MPSPVHEQQDRSDRRFSNHLNSFSKISLSASIGSFSADTLEKGCRGVVLQRLPVPDPLAVGVVEPVRQPLGLQEVVALHAQEQRLATPVHKWLRISQVAKNKFREWLWLKRHTLVVGF